MLNYIVTINNKSQDSTAIDVYKIRDLGIIAHKAAIAIICNAV